MGTAGVAGSGAAASASSQAAEGSGRGEPASNASASRGGEEKVPPPPTAPGNDTPGSSFECNICLETPNDPVVTLCGHLFCWACLYRWLRGHAHTNECPVCKAGVEEDKVVPLYGRGKASSDPRQRPIPGAEVPNRPTGRRPEATRHARAEPGLGFFPGVGVGGPFASAQIGGFTVSAGFGLFPALFGGWHFAAAPGVGLHHPGAPGYGHGGPPGPGGVRNLAAEEQNAFLSRLLFALGICVILAITFA